MENLILSLNVVLPLAITMIVGYLLKEKKMLNEKTISEMNSLTFKLFLPTLLFYNVYTTKLDKAINLKLISFSVIGTIIIFIVAWIAIINLEKENKNRGTMIQCVFRSNFVIFGMSVSEALFGDIGKGVTSMVVGVVVPLFNVLAVICLEAFNGSKIEIKKIIQNIFSNNLIKGALLAMVLVYFKITIPYPIEKTISDIAKVGTPLAIMMLGASFNIQDSKKYTKQIRIITLSKLIIVPLIMIPLGLYFGFRDAEIICLVALFCSPTAVNSFTMAKEMNSNYDLTSQIIVYTSMFSVITVFLWILIIKSLNFI